MHSKSCSEHDDDAILVVMNNKFGEFTLKKIVEGLLTMHVF